MPHRILIVEDDQRLGEMLALHLAKLGGEVQVASDGERALVACMCKPFDLVLLDRNLPGMDGLEVCIELRRRFREIRILMLTALTEEFDFVAGLEGGADDYVGKPFRLAELMARVKALLRRGAGMPEGLVTFGSLSIDPNSRRVRMGEGEIRFTAREFDLLLYLAEHQDRVCSREEILAQVWQSDVRGYEDSVNTIVKRVRKKLDGSSTACSYIETIRGIGYRFTCPG